MSKHTPILFLHITYSRLVSAEHVIFKLERWKECWGVSELSFKAARKRYCMDCAHFHGGLTARDRQLLERLLERYGAEVMLKSWVQLGQVGKPSGHGVDEDKARAAEILRRRVFCWREKAMVSAVDVACAFWRAKSPEP